MNDGPHLTLTAPPFRERWLLWRNRLLGDARFQRLAMRLPLVRGKARGSAAAMFGMATGFVYTQTLTACVELGIIERLRTAPATVAALCAQGAIGEDAMQRLLAAGAALDLVEPLDGDRWTLGQMGAALATNAGALAMIAHHNLLYRDLTDPVALLRRGRGGGALAGFWPYAEGEEPGEAANPYSTLMAASQPMVAEQVLDAVDFGRQRHLLDIGGGHGAFLMAVAARHPALAMTLFDLPGVATGARTALAAAGLDRITVAPGSFITDPLPPGADIVTVVRILHDHDDAVVAALLAKARAALPQGGRLVIAEPMAGTRGARAMGDAYFGLYLWAMGSGRPRTAESYRAMLRAAGFQSVREAPTSLPMIARVLIASV
jgi:demethylspheroidene O-methyltransferase